MLDGDGIFTVPLVPDGWTAWSQNGCYQLSPPAQDAAVTISPYQRSPNPLRDHEARDALGAFLTHALHTDTGQILEMPAEPRQQRAFCRTVTDASDEPTEWFIGCIIWPETMLMCTFNGRPGHPEFRTAEQMIASIIPADAG